MANVWQQPLPEIYNQLSEPELRLRIELAKEALGKRLVILGHHYQQDAVIDFADFTGDSFELSRKAAEQKQAEYVVFCGVHFMAESADILTPELVRVILPDLGAGSSVAIRRMRWATRWTRWSSGTRSKTSAATTRRSSATPTSCCGRATARCTNSSGPSTSIRCARSTRT